jgi:SOS response regulatory protein OraA/RecX
MLENQNPKKKKKKNKSIENYCSILFKYRPRTEHEIRKKCLEKGFESKEIENFIEELYGLRLLDDLRFSKMYIDDGIRLKVKGKYLLVQELRTLGVSRETVEKAFNDLNYEEVDKALREDYRRRGFKDSEKWKRRMLRRGFELRKIIEVINDFNDSNVEFL